MAKSERIEAIRELEEARKSRVISYLTADRGLVNVPVAEDVVRIIYRHLKAIGHTSRLDLFLYSRGGDTMVPWPLVNLCRRYCDRFNVLVPYRAHSAATQIALGADGIVMGPLGELTQVDPSIKSDFTPLGSQPGQTLQVSVEDLRGYFSFLDEALKEDSAPKGPLDLLKDSLHPLAIGQVFRQSGSTRYMSESLLGLHMSDKDEIRRIAQAMVTGLHVHSHRINQPEARSIGLPAVAATDEEADAMWHLYELYETDMALAVPIRPSTMFPNAADAFVELKDQRGVFVESTGRTDVYVMDLVAARSAATVISTGSGGYPGVTPVTPGTPAWPTTRTIWGPQVTVSIERESWTTE
jgi:hypothetical protein